MIKRVKMQRRCSLQSFADEFANALSDWWLHHREVVALDGNHGAVLGTQKGVPAIGTEVGTVLQEPLHALGIIFLWWRTWVIWLATDTFGRPDEQCWRCLEVVLGLELWSVGSQSLDAVLEMR